jgi:hypothetical protein
MNKTLILSAALAAALALSACAGAPRPAAAPAAGQPAAAAPTAAPTDPPAPTATIAPTATAAPTSTPAPTDTPAPTPRPPDYYDRFPRDPDGRLIGLQDMPILNYSPTMITGKPCPRVKRWGVRRIALEPPAQPYYVVDNPCVIQNALDDGLRALFFWPSGYPDQEYYKREIVPLLKTDPVAQWVLDEGARRDFSEKLGGGYRVCDKPTYTLLDVDAGVPLSPDGPGQPPGGRRFQARMYQVAGEPFTCRVYRRENGEFWYEYSLDRDRLDSRPALGNIVIEFQLTYNPQTGRWRGELFQPGDDIPPLPNYRERVLFLLEQSPVKP